VFMCDVAARFASRVQLTTDGLKAYLNAVEGAFGADVDFAQPVKLYGATPDSAKGQPGRMYGRPKMPIEGKPDPKHIGTSFVERQNLTMRMNMRRFTRLTNAISKKAKNHAYSIALHCTFYNFVRIHKMLRVSPAMAAGLTTRVCKMKDIVALVKKAEVAAAPKARGPYKPRASKIAPVISN